MCNAFELRQERADEAARGGKPAEPEGELLLTAQRGGGRRGAEGAAGGGGGGGGGRPLHSHTLELNLRTFGNTSLTLELNLSTFKTHPRVTLGYMGDKVRLS